MLVIQYIKPLNGFSVYHLQLPSQHYQGVLIYRERIWVTSELQMQLLQFFCFIHDLTTQCVPPNMFRIPGSGTNYSYCETPFVTIYTCYPSFASRMNLRIAPMAQMNFVCDTLLSPKYEKNGIGIWDGIS